MIDADGSRFLDFRAGAPVGAVEHTQYAENTVTVGDGATMIAYTDGLVERRGEILDTGLERLRAAATSVPHDSLDELVSSVLNQLLGDDDADDTAIVAVRWAPKGA